MSQPTPQGPRVLLVEDMRNDAQELIESLCREGYQVDVAMTAEEAVRAVQGVTYAVVLMDIELDLGESDRPVISDNTPPERAGLEVIRHIRRALGMVGLPVIVVSGLDHRAFWHDLQQELFSSELHVAAIVKKPTGPRAVIRELARVTDWQGPLFRTFKADDPSYAE